MSGRVYCGFDGTEPTTKVDGLMWGSPMGELLVWYNGQWRPRGGSVTTINPYGATTPVATPTWAAVAICGPQIGTGFGPISPPAPPPPYQNGQCWFNTTTMRLSVFDTSGFMPVP